MQDDLRADMLFRALAGEEPSPDEMGDDELRALVGLGARLDAMRPALAALNEAEQAFNPAFAQELHRTLIAAHPAGVEHPAPDNRAVSPRRAIHLMSRRFLVLLALIAVLAIVAVTIIVQDGRQTALVGTAAVSPTRVAPRSSARSFAALAPRTTPVAGQAEVTPTSPGPAPLTVGAPAPPRVGASPTPAPAGESAAASGTSPMHMNTFAPQASDGSGVFRYTLPSTLPKEPAAVPLYRIVQAPATKARARAIAATFTGMHPITGSAGLSFTGDNALLRITPGSGVVDYLRTSTAQAPAATGALPTARRESIARAWLVTHLLLPKTTGPLTVSVTEQGTVDAVRITPTLQLPLLTGAQTPVAVVEVDGAGNVVDAHVAWANLRPAGTATIVSPAAATSGPGVPKATEGQATPVAMPEVKVSRVTLVYELVGQGDTPTLRPVYQLTGTLNGRPVTTIVPASRHGT